MFSFLIGAFHTLSHSGELKFLFQGLILTQRKTGDGEIEYFVIYVPSIAIGWEKG